MKLIMCTTTSFGFFSRVEKLKQANIGEIFKDFALHFKVWIGEPAVLGGEHEEGSGLDGVCAANIFRRQELQILGNDDSCRQVGIPRNHPIGSLKNNIFHICGEYILRT